MRLDILCESDESRLSLLEDEGGAVGDASAADAPAPSPSGDPALGFNSTADVAMHPQYLGFSYRGGTVRLRGGSRKRKSLHEEALNQHLNSLLEDYSNRISKNRDFAIIADS